MLAYIPYMDPMGIGSISTIPVSLGWQIIPPICQASRQGLGRGRCWSPGEVVTRNDLAPSHWTSFRHLGCSRWRAWLSDGCEMLWNNMFQSESWSTDLDELGDPYFRKPPCGGCSFLWFVVCFSPCCHRYMTFDPSSMWCSSSPAVIYEIKACPGTLGPRSHYASCIVAGWFGVPKWILLRQGVARDLKQFISVSMFLPCQGRIKSGKLT